MTYDPIDTNDDGVVDADVDNQSVSTERLHSKSQNIVSTGVQRAQHQHHHGPTGVTNKTRILSVGDEITWTNNDIYAQSLIEVGDILDNPLSRYYCYYSEDHSSGAIGMAHADEIYGEWTDYGPVFDAHAGQDETPVPAWDPVESELLLYYHSTDIGSNVSQATGLATSAGDGTSFADQDAIIDPDHPMVDHTGYFRPVSFGNFHIAYHLIQSGDGTTFGMSWSRDRRDWTWDRKPIGRTPALAGADGSRRIEWNSSSVLNLNGESWWIGEVKDFVASGTSRGNAEISAAPYHGPRRIGSPRQIASPTESWEGPVLYSPSVFAAESAVHLSYTTGGDTIGLATIGGAY